ncbi:MAG: beta-galactosidase [Clostridia bacterium]|nr:beta-galactosidase [Clostridia bacterium]
MKQYINEKFPHFIHGGDYNPEQWIDTKEIWDEDMRLMNLANCNEMTVGIFSWANLEPEEGRYDFSFLDEIIDKVYAAGGRVILATPSGARPRWLAEKYPEVLRVRDNGVRNLYGTRHNHCYTAPIYREKVRAINRKLAERYGKHPAVLAWHISNEYVGRCYCPLCEEAFRSFVKERYEGDIHKLNHAWWSTFWSHAYTSFDQIEFPCQRGERSIHGLNLDFKRFCSHQTADFMRNEVEAVREFCPDLPVTTNLMPRHEAANYRELAEVMDVISWDSYPHWHSGDHEKNAIKTAFWHELFRTLKHRSFLLMETSPGLVNWHPYNKLRRPGMDRLNALQAVAHGSDSVQYFQWRKSRGSSEKFHGAVVDHVGNEHTRVFRAVAETGATLKAIDEVCGTTVTSRVAIFYDWENRWAIEDAQFFTFGTDKKYSATCEAYYKPLWERGINADIVGPHDDLSAYDLVIAPMQYMVDEQTGANLTSYVEQGGTLYATYCLGMVDGTDLCHLGGFPGAGLRKVFGIWNEELDTLYPEDRVTVKTADGSEYTAVDCCELIHAEGAQVLASYASEFYAGMPALTVHTYGKGKAYYQAFRDTGDFWDTVCEGILKELDIQSPIPTPLPALVTAHVREDGDIRYLFVENYSDTPVTELPLGGTWQDMESGRVADTVSLNAFDVKVLKQK